MDNSRQKQMDMLHIVFSVFHIYCRFRTCIYMGLIIPTLVSLQYLPSLLDVCTKYVGI